MAMCSEVFKPCGIDCNGPERLYIQAPGQQQVPQYSQPALYQPQQPQLQAQGPQYHAQQQLQPTFQEIPKPMPPVLPTPAAPLAPASAPTTVYGGAAPIVPAEPPKLAAEAPKASLPPETEVVADAKPQPRTSAGFQAAKAGVADDAQVEGGWGGDPADVRPNFSPPLDKGEPEPEMQGDVINYDPARERSKSVILTVLALGIQLGIVAFFLIGRFGYVGPTCDPEGSYRSCQPCGSGLAIPLGGEWENSWSEVGRAPMYFVCLAWLFLGTAIVCDSFMAAIEKITSKEKAVWLRVKGGSQHKFHIRVWNSTIANLTLMALGSSAPEILLSCIELAGNSFFAAALGPSTIVGSAAFNLLVITAVCVSALPPKEIRKVEIVSVFLVTASVSLWAYLWLLIILMVLTPNKVDILEAVLTFVMFPVLLVIAFAADRGFLARLCCSSNSAPPDDDAKIRMEQEKLSKIFSKQISFNAVKIMMEAKKQNCANRSSRRSSAIKGIVGGGANKGVTFGFRDNATVVLECEQTVAVPVVASRAPGCTAQIRYATKEQDAKAGKRFVQTEGIITFEPHETEKEIYIPIIDDNSGGHATVEFGVELVDLQILSGTTPRTQSSMRLASSWNRVIIVEDDDAGVLSFDADEVMVGPGMNSVTVNVSRSGGNVGDISVSYATIADTAIEGEDFTPASGTLDLASGQESTSIVVQVRSTKPATERRFRIMLNEATGGARFDPNRDGGENSALCEVIIPGQTNKKPFSLMPSRLSMEEWSEQFRAAIYVGGGPEEQSQASTTDVIVHLVSVFFKLVFSAIPPPSVAGGWACFFAALFMIGCVTLLIGDAASLLGCAIGINDEITAITLVALGTSLPDTLASKTAALQDDTADNSVGNVTGSNSVNVFLGLGLPWTIGAIYWHVQGVTPEWLNYQYGGETYATLYHGEYPSGGFIMPAGALGFSVGVFVAVATCCLFLLFIRRQLYGGELGGPAHACRRDSFILVLLWAIYIGASIMKSFEII